MGPVLDTDEFDFQQDRYTDLVGAKFVVRSEDYTFEEIVTLERLSSQNRNAVEISALSITPTANMIFELANYSDQEDTEVADLLKLKYTFTMRQTEIDSVTDNQEFTVLDATGLFDGQRISVHSDDYTRDEISAIIDTVAGNIVTLTEPLDFTPVIGDKLEHKGYQDGDGYALR